MARLTEAEKEEFLELSRSAQLREDMRILKRNQEELAQHLSLDDYLQFLNDLNELHSHVSKPFHKITGRFLL